MRSRVALAISSVVLLIAAVPWIAISLSSRPPVPADLQQAPADYQSTVTAAQNATREAERRATSSIRIRPVSTAPANEPDHTTVTPVNTEVPVTPTSVTEQRTASPSSSSVSLPTSTVISDTSLALPTPMGGWVAVDDVITPDMLTTQITQDIDDVSLTELTVTFTAEEFNVVGLINVSPLVEETIEVTGTFTINRENLVAEIDLIRVAAEDVTSEYRGQLESQINTSLYRLLPQRFVQSYDLTDTHLYVHSRMRP